MLASLACSVHGLADSLHSLPCGTVESHKPVLMLKSLFKETNMFDVVTRNTPLIFWRSRTVSQMKRVSMYRFVSNVSHTPVKGFQLRLLSDFMSRAMWLHNLLCSSNGWLFVCSTFFCFCYYGPRPPIRDWGMRQKRRQQKRKTIEEKKKRKERKKERKKEGKKNSLDQCGKIRWHVKLMSWKSLYFFNKRKTKNRTLWMKILKS